MGQKFNDAMQLAMKQQRFARRIESVLNRVQDDLISDIKTEHFQRTSGGISTKRLNAAGNPFARRKRRGSFVRQGLQKSGKRQNQYRQSQSGAGPVSVFPKLPINRQTGTLQRSLISKTRRRVAGERVDVVGFRESVARYAKYVLAAKGTSKMVPRGYVQTANKFSRRKSKESVNRFRRESYKLYVSTR